MRPHPKHCIDATHQTQTYFNQFTVEFGFLSAVRVGSKKPLMQKKDETKPNIAAVEIFFPLFSFCNFIFGLPVRPVYVFQFR